MTDPNTPRGTARRIRRLVGSLAVGALATGVFLTLGAALDPAPAEAKPKRSCEEIEADFAYWAGIYGKFTGEDQKQILVNARGVLAEGRAAGC